VTATTPVEKVAEVLSAANFRRVMTPLSLAGIQFDIPAAFVGTGTSSDLILLVDTAFDTEKRIQQKVEGIARALDSIGSMRSLTTVVTGPRPLRLVMDAMSRVCRVLPLGVSNDANQAADILNWLAVLLPLNLPEPSDVAADAMTVFTNMTDNPVTMTLIEASSLGRAEVERCLSILISKPLDDISIGNEL
jgi:hypothetical protein